MSADHSPQLQVTVNGEARELPPPMSVAELLRHLGVVAQQVAVERNRAIVSKADYAATQLTAGDEIEIVTFVGGG